MYINNIHIFPHALASLFFGLCSFICFFKQIAILVLVSTPIYKLFQQCKKLESSAVRFPHYTIRRNTYVCSEAADIFAIQGKHGRLD